MSHDFLSVYTAKNYEYLLAVSYLFLFVPFWRYVWGARPAAVLATSPSVGKESVASLARPAKATTSRVPPRAEIPTPGAGWFEVPAGVWLHPGHTWARLLDDGMVAVGLDDLAHRLVAPRTATLPALGSRLFQGDPAFELVNGAKSVSALAPVDGTVVAVNPKAQHMEEAANDPYGSGWLFKVKPARLSSNLRQLETGNAARKLVDEAAALLAMRADPQMAAALQDGGAPVHGIAAALAGDEWDTFAREFLRS